MYFYRSNQQSRGLGIIELMAGFLLVVLVISLFLDVGLLVVGTMINDEIVSDAARAAAMGPPGELAVGKNRIVKSTQAPYKRALTIVENKSKNLPPLFFELDPTINISETVFQPIPVLPLGGILHGSVRVETIILVHPKFAIGLFNPGSISLTASKTCPYTWVMKSQLVL